MKDAEELDLPQDAPLRVRAWWRFWRGWRTRILALVVLVGAWWTKPDEAALSAALQEHGAIEAAGRGEPSAQVQDQWVWSTLQLHSWNRVIPDAKDSTDPRPIIELGADGKLVIYRKPLLAIGFLGMVWVLD